MPKSISPLTRLDALSKEHQDGLLFVWKIRQGLTNDVAIELVADYCIWYWKNHIKPHFYSEEQVLFSFLPQDDGLVYRLKNQRNDLRELFMELTKSPDTLLVGMLASLFEFHIRFEERIFLPYLDQRLSATELDTLVSLLENFPSSDESWKDAFWLTECKK